MKHFGNLIKDRKDKEKMNEKEIQLKELRQERDKINEKTLFCLYMQGRRMSLFLKENDEVKLHYDADSEDIDAIEFELHNAFVTAIESYDLKYLSIQHDEGKIVSAAFYLKDKTTAYHIDF